VLRTHSRSPQTRFPQLAKAMTLLRSLYTFTIALLICVAIPGESSQAEVQKQSAQKAQTKNVTLKKPKVVTKKKTPIKKVASKATPRPVVMFADSKVRGWDYLADRLIRDGFSPGTITALFQDRRMPWFTEIPFAVAPREGHHMYAGFNSKSRIEQARSFLEKYSTEFERAEDRFKVSRYAVAALLMIETGFGRNTGKEIVLYRLARLASAADPENAKRNYERLRKTDPTVTLEAVIARAKYLEETFYPEVGAVLQIAREEQFDPLGLRGSSAGAFGIPQFLPTSYLRFARDHNDDGRIDLFHESDAIASTANFLAHFGWDDEASDEVKRAVIWKYNHSEAYVDTALSIKKTLAAKSAAGLAGKRVTLNPSGAQLNQP